VDDCVIEDLLLSASLRLESEDALVRLLCDLGGEHLRLLCDVRIDFLSISGLFNFFDRFNSGWTTESEVDIGQIRRCLILFSR
jgi:hypothetical protein